MKVFGSEKINVVWTNELVDDLMNFNNFDPLLVDVEIKIIEKFQKQIIRSENRRSKLLNILKKLK